MKAIAAFFLVFMNASSQAKAPFISEAELVEFLNKYDYSIQSNEKQKVEIDYHEESDSWNVKIEKLCQPVGCACIDCNSYINVHKRNGKTKMAIVYDG